MSEANPTDRSGPLSQGEVDEFLGETHLCRLACLKPDGWPYVIPLWYVWYGQRIYFIGRERSAWVSYIRDDPRVSLVIDEASARHRRAQLTGSAAIVEGPIGLAGQSERWRVVGASMAERYMADARGQTYAKQTAERPRYLIEVVPTEITTWQGGAWHPRYYR
ncbi:MAG: pyridoxamine 5'-phosphate oxidase family protein [Chloroflexota bacterium]